MLSIITIGIGNVALFVHKEFQSNLGANQKRNYNMEVESFGRGGEESQEVRTLDIGGFSVARFAWKCRSTIIRYPQT